MIRAILPVLLVAAPAYAVVGGPGGDVIGTSSGIDMLLLALYVLLALVVSFMCSIAEAVLLSVTPSYIEELKNRRPKLAALLKQLKIDDIDQSLAAILTLNTIAHTVGAIGAGAKATIVFGSAWFGLFSALMTLLILFLSEIIPKTLGAVYWSNLTGPVAVFVRGLILLLYPLVWISKFLTKLISRGKAGHVFSREEFIAMARIGEQSGHLRGDELKIINNLFQFSMMKIEDVMTPRTVITAFPEKMTVNEASERVTASPFSRFPVFENDIDHITGFVLKDDVLIAKAQGRDQLLLVELRLDIHTVPETNTLPSLFEDLLTQRKHIAVVIDEYGGTSGLVTLEDLVETLTGQEIMDEKDSIANMRAVARNRWKRRMEKIRRPQNKE